MGIIGHIYWSISIPSNTFTRDTQQGRQSQIRRYRGGYRREKRVTLYLILFLCNIWVIIISYNFLMDKNSTKDIILIIEDDANLVFVLSKLIRQMGYKAIHSYNGCNGIQKALRKEIKLIILDICLPDISGHDVIEKVKELTQKPIIVISNDKSIENQVKSFNKKANIFHHKPIDYTLLTAQIQSLMKDCFVKKKCNKTVNISEEIYFNPNNYSINIKDRVVNLTIRETKFLELLLKYDGRVVSKKLISEKISLREESLLQTSVNTMICRLRMKLNLPEKDSFIETIHGCGYRLKREKKLLYSIK